MNAAQRRDEGMTRAERNADEAWKSLAWEWINRYLRSHATLFCDDLWASGLPRPRNARALGPIISRAVRENLMVESGNFRRSVASNLSPKPVWRSLIYTPKGVAA